VKLHLFASYTAVAPIAVRIIGNFITGKTPFNSEFIPVGMAVIIFYPIAIVIRIYFAITTRTLLLDVAIYGATLILSIAVLWVRKTRQDGIGK
jgi:hypothetical protein